LSWNTPKGAGGRLLGVAIAAVASRELSVLFLTCSVAGGEGEGKGAEQYHVAGGALDSPPAVGK
jgi:hypothetical protein